VCVSDDGQGFDVDAMTRSGEGGRGLRNLRRRARALGGDVQVSSRPGYTCVTLVLPIERGERVPEADTGEYERVPVSSRESR
jgi:two-component system NarL family sensor kinase